MTYDPGQFNCRIVIEKRTGAVDAANQPLDDWTPVMSRWAKPLTASGMSVVRGSVDGVEVSPTKYSWRIRYQPSGIDVGMRLNYKGFIGDILDVRHDFAGRQWTDIVCQVGGKNG